MLLVDFTTEVGVNT